MNWPKASDLNQSILRIFKVHLHVLQFLPGKISKMRCQTHYQNFLSCQTLELNVSFRQYLTPFRLKTTTLITATAGTTTTAKITTTTTTTTVMIRAAATIITPTTTLTIITTSITSTSTN